MSRLPKRVAAEATEAYRTFTQWLTTGAWERREGPFRAYLVHPELGNRVNSVNQILRNQGSIPARLREVVILTNAVHWETPFEWFAHERLALEAGLDPKALARLAAGKTPNFAKPDEDATHALSREILETHFLRAATFNRARRLLGEKGLIEVITTLGFYSMLSLVINGYEVAMAKGAKTPIQRRARRAR